MRRRLAFAFLALAMAASLGVLAWRVLAGGGWGGWEVAIFAAFLLNLPWLALAGATGVAGFLLLACARDPAARLVPGFGGAAPAEEPPTLVGVCVRDEDLSSVFPALAALLRGLGHPHAVAILSDTTDPARGAAEDAAVARFAAAFAPGRVLHRRRLENTGWKAGNVMEFLDRHAEGFEFLLLLDADSSMSPDLVQRMVAAMAANPRLALLQATIAGEGASTRFAHWFAVGHGPGARCWAAGQAWWQGGEGAYWGHNALVRIAAFRAHARLDPLPDGTHLLSHDFVEAARLHAAGWEVRVLPVAGGASTERHPPDLPAYLDRDRRWAAGNLQWRHLLGDRRLSRLGRFQMVQAMAHYLLGPVWFALLPLAAINAATGGGEGTPRDALVALLLASYAVLHAPRLLGHLVAAPRTGWRAALGESTFLLLFESLLAFDKTLTVIASLTGRRRPGWPAQRREGRAVGWGEAWDRLWPHSLAGAAMLALFVASGSAFAVVLALPALAGMLLAVPFCVWGSALARPEAGALGNRQTGEETA